MKCGEVLDGGLLSRDPCDFKERLAHLVNQRLMRITTQTPSIIALCHFSQEVHGKIRILRLPPSSWDEMWGKVCVWFLCMCLCVCFNERGKLGLCETFIYMTDMFNDALYQHSLKSNLISFIKVCLQTLGSTTAYVKTSGLQRGLQEIWLIASTDVTWVNISWGWRLQVWRRKKTWWCGIRKTWAHQISESAMFVIFNIKIRYKLLTTFSWNRSSNNRTHM